MISAGGGVRALASMLPPIIGRGRAHQKAVEKLVFSLGELKGLPMKVGQFMSYGSRSLPEPTRDGLSVLLTQAQPLPFDRVCGVVREELSDDADELLERMDRTPVAVASIGQVHKTVLSDGTAAAVKVQYPGIDVAIEQDCIPAAIGAYVASWLNPGAKREAFVEEAKSRLLEECDYLREARMQAEFAERFREHPVIWIPPVYSRYSSRRVLTTAYVEGHDLDDFLARDPSMEERDRAGAALFDFYFGSLFTFGRYNRDPHAGNYLFLDDGRVAFLDHGSTRVFERELIVALSELTLAVVNDDGDWMHDALSASGLVEPNQRYDRELARRLLRWFYGPLLKDELSSFESPAELVPDLQRHKRELRRLVIPGEFLFLLRMRLGLAAVLERLGARANWWKLQRRYFERSITRLVEHEVVLTDPGERTIEVVREIREVAGIGVREAKELVERTPAVAVKALHRREAEALCRKLEAIGARAEARRRTEPA